MKLRNISKKRNKSIVAPLAGAWIEIVTSVTLYIFSTVAPLAGAWIEIGPPACQPGYNSVAPLAGAWIEIWILGSV